MKSDRQVLAVDFGTANSYFCKCPSDEIIPSPVDFLSDRTGIETAVLYRKGRSPLIGSFAIHTWGEATLQERRDYRLRTRFKPEIAVDDDSFKCSVDFLATVKEEAQGRHIPFNPQDRDVYVGVPCEASESYRSSLVEIAEMAGYGKVRTVPEPLGALLFHLSQKDIAPSEAMESVLVVDFGGGTCDAALVNGLDITRSWGDWNLGGRLFDDLFYRLLLERNPGLREKLVEAGADYFVHWYWCRKLKESFSSSMARDRGELWSGTAGVYGAIRHLSWDEFMERARVYVPTSEMASTIGPGCPGVVVPENLMDQFDSFISKLGETSPQIVIMAGGSSLWPFVADLIKERFPQTRLIRSDQPYGVVAKGMAILPALRRRNDKTIRLLKSDLDRFIEEDIRGSVIDEMLENILLIASSNVEDLVFNSLVVPELRRFRETGGSVASLRKKIEARLDEIKGTMNDVLQKDIERAIRAMPVMVTDRLSRWFLQKGVKFLPVGLSVSLRGDDMDLTSSIAPRCISSLTDLMDIVDYSVAVLSATVIASICGGGGIALIATGIPGLLIGGSMGVGGYLLGRKKMMELASDVKIPSMLAKRLLSDKRIARSIEKGRKDLLKKLEETLHQKWTSVDSELMEAIRRAVEGEINALSLVNQIDAK